MGSVYKCTDIISLDAAYLYKGLYRLMTALYDREIAAELLGKDRDQRTLRHHAICAGSAACPGKFADLFVKRARQE